MSLKIEVNINNSWHTLTPVFNNFRIIKYRDNEKLLQIRYSTSGAINLFDSDYTLLRPFINNYDIECRVTETVNGTSIYNSYLNLSEKVNLTTRFIEATIIIIDDYYDFYEKPIKNIDYKYNISESDIDKNKISINEHVQAQPYISESMYFSPFAYKIKDIIEFIANNITSIKLNYNFDFFNKFTEVFLHEENQMTGASYFDNRDSLLQELYSGLPSEVTINNRNEENFKLSLNDVFVSLEQVASVYWFLKNGTFHVQNYKDHVFGFGIDLTNYRNNHNWETEANRIIDYGKDKPSIINYNNNETDLIGYIAGQSTRFFNPCAAKNINFENLRYSKKDISLAFTVFFNSSQKQIRANWETDEWRWYNFTTGNGLMEVSQAQINLLEQEIKYYREYYDTTLPVFGDPIQNGDVLGLTPIDAIATFFSTVNYYIDVWYDNDTPGYFNFCTKWIYLSKNEIVKIVFKNNQSSNQLYCSLRDKDGNIIDNYTCNGSIEQETLIPENGYYYIRWYVQNPNGINLGTYKITDLRLYSNNRNYNLNSDKLYDNSTYYYLYNTNFSLEKLIKNYTTNLSQDSGELEDLQTDETESLNFIKNNDIIQQIQVPINENLENIDFDLKIFSNTLGWARVDRIERLYDQDMDSLCIVTLSNNILRDDTKDWILETGIWDANGVWTNDGIWKT